MAQKVSVQMICDVDHGEEVVPAVKSVMLGFETDCAEIDLCAPHFDEYAEYLRPLIEGGRKKAWPKAAPAKKTTTVDNTAVREWAQSAGVELNSRGRIPQAVLEQYAAAKKKK